MNKIVLLSAGVLLLGGLFVLAYKLTSPTKPVAQTTSPVAEQGVFPVSGTVPNTVTTVPAQRDTSVGSIPTSNFLQDPVTVQDTYNPGYYYLGYQAADNPPYTITYINATQYFNIALLQEPIGSVRTDAEQFLLTHLGITQDQMCKLAYMVSVPDRVNSQFSGRNLGFSFCPGAIVLPK